MKHAGLLLVTGAVAAVVVLCLGAVTPAPSQGSSEVEQLKKEVAALRQKVEALEAWQKETLVSGVLKGPTHYWSKGESNGVTYYVMPIDNTRTAPSAAKKPAPLDKTPAPPKTVDNTIKP